MNQPSTPKKLLELPIPGAGRNSDKNGVAPATQAAPEEQSTAASPRLSQSMLLVCFALMTSCLFFFNWLFPKISFWMGSLANFQWQFVVMMIVISGILAWKGQRNWMLVFLLVAIIPGLSLASLYLPGNQPPPGPTKIRLMSLNVFDGNDHPEQVGNLIRDVDPDVMVLIEVHDQLLQQLDAELAEYKYQFGPKNGTLICSKIPGTDYQWKRKILDSTFSTTLAVRLDVAEQPVMILAVHPDSPISADRLRNREAELWQTYRFASFLRNWHHVMVVGDFNATTHTPMMNRFLADKYFRDSRKGFGIQNSWPAWFPPAMICIDHVLVSENVHVHDRYTERNVGSDHLPVVADISFHPRPK